jgi:hypothetical protein
MSAMTGGATLVETRSVMLAPDLARLVGPTVRRGPTWLRGDSPSKA